MSKTAPIAAKKIIPKSYCFERLLAEASATEHQLMAIFGWSDSKMAQHYTKAAQSSGLSMPVSSVAKPT